jgi:sulfoxide reductase heme-binding subunit YedZ
MFGIYSFFYTSLHMVAYLDLELSWLWDELLWELQERHFISIGLASWLALLMLTLTSPKAIQRRMKKWWRRVHRLVYPLSLLVIVHFVMSTKETNLQPYYYLAIVVVLLLHRILVAYLPTLVSREDTGMEHTRK